MTAVGSMFRMYYLMDSKYEDSAQDRHSPSEALHTSTVDRTCSKAQTIDAPKSLESHVCFNVTPATAESKYSLHLVPGNVFMPSYLTVCNNDSEPEQIIVG